LKAGILNPVLLLVGVFVLGLGFAVNAPAWASLVFITGYRDIPMAVRAIKEGAVEFLAKPFRDQDLLDAIQHGLESLKSKIDCK
jgi:FixJ family two-component response regulator